ncbi:helix-turn-helix transcriptional regulator [Sorangium sp. So ce134]
MLTGADAMEIPVVAKRFAVTPRTLQRRLRDEGASFRALLDDVRRELSMRYLRDPRRSASEAAYLLGFRGVSAFYRGFERWTGLTPAELRRQAR